MTEWLYGKVVGERYVPDAEPDFHIFELVVDWSRTKGIGNDKITCKGTTFGLKSLPLGIEIGVEGQYQHHPKYGKQLIVEGWSPYCSTATSALQWIENLDLIDNEDLPYGLVNLLGSRTLEWLQNAHKDPHRIIAEEIPPNLIPNPADLNGLINGIERYHSILEGSKLAVWLAPYGLKSAQISAIWNRFGTNVFDVVNQNPYRLMEVRGIEFNKIDAVGARQGVVPSDPRRLEAGVLGALNMLVQQDAHLYCPYRDIPTIVSRFGSIHGVPTFNALNESSALALTIKNLVNRDLIVEDQDCVYLWDWYYYELRTAEYLAQRIEWVAKPLDWSTTAQQFSEYRLSEQQVQTLEMAANHGIGLCVGPPGTGKTTVIKALVQMFRHNSLSVQLMAPTGMAAKRLSTVTDLTARTIHKALGYDGFRWKLNDFNLLDCNVVIVDEVSMVDQELIYRILNALPIDSRLILVGDHNQLPSVGPGNVLRELLKSKIPKVVLEQVFRQSGTSDIVEAAHRIRKGQDPLEGLKSTGSEIHFSTIDNEDDILNSVMHLARGWGTRDKHFQVLTAQHRGTLGTQNLNRALQLTLNPDQSYSNKIVEIKDPTFGDQILYKGDRVMIIKNLHREELWNGDQGVVDGYHKGKIAIKIEDRIIELSIDQVRQAVRLAYCTTVHKAQGQEYPIVIIPIHRQQGRMLQRNLLYTAITRGRNKVVLLGTADAIAQSVRNDRVMDRNTMLNHQIEQALETLMEYRVQQEIAARNEFKLLGCDPLPVGSVEFINSLSDNDIELPDDPIEVTNPIQEESNISPNDTKVLRFTPIPLMSVPNPDILKHLLSEKGHEC